MGRRGLTFAVSTLELFVKTLFRISLTFSSIYLFIYLFFTHFFSLAFELFDNFEKKSRFYEIFMKHSWFVNG